MDTRKKWNTKHKERICRIMEPVPNERLKNLSAYLLGGKALDLACGLGGNSLFLARLNYQVQAVDISDVAVNYVRKQAEKYHLNIHPQACDLTERKNHNWPSNSFHLVVITYYLDRSLFPIVKNTVNEDGYFFMETYYRTTLNDNQGVSNQYKLLPKELLSEFEDWTIIFFEEDAQESRQTIFCQKC